MCDVSFRLFCCARAAEIKAILEEGIAVDCPDENGYTPLYNATMYDKAPVVEFLIAQGAAVDVPNKNGERTHLSAISLPVLPSSSSVQPSLPPSLHLTTRAIASFSLSLCPLYLASVPSLNLHAGVAGNGISYQRSVFKGSRR